MNARLALAASLISLSLASATMAAVSVQTETYTIIPRSPGTPENVLLEFDKFDPAVGTLNSIFVEFDFRSSNNTASFDNDGPSTLNGYVQYGTRANFLPIGVDLADQSVSPLVGTLDGLTRRAISLGPDDGDGGVFDTSGPDGDVIPPTVITDSASGTIGTQFHGDYTLTGGTSNVYWIRASINWFADSGGLGSAASVGLRPIADGSVTITYDFTPFTTIPEPTGAIVFATLFGMAVTRRRPA